VETTKQGFGHGEEMLYLEVLDEFSDDIARSYGDYGQILNNFLAPTRNAEYIFHTIIQNFKSAGYVREYEDACKALLSAAQNYWIDIDLATAENLLHN
jgi:hypothetical protein